MALRLTELNLLKKKEDLRNLPEGKLLINTINAYSFNLAQRDEPFIETLKNCDVLIPDGASIIWACNFLNHPNPPESRTAGWDLFVYEMHKWNARGGKVMFFGSSEKVLAKIRERAANIYPNLEVVTYSPPFKPNFSDEDNKEMVAQINAANPDLLWIGMTAPKQEKWTYAHWDELDIHCHVGSIGAVFDFFAGTKKRAPLWIQKFGLEWLHRFCSEPKRMFRRYVIGNPRFIQHVLIQKIFSKK